MDTIVNMHVTVHVKDAMKLMGCATQDVNWAGEVFIARKVCALYTVILNAWKTDILKKNDNTYIFISFVFLCLTKG